jgi:hypothetical protein
VGYWPWGLRVNAGGRLNVNGVPTNRVVFVQIETIQENPLHTIAPEGPMLAFRDLFFGNQDIPATPLPEARIRYTDFPTVSGGLNVSIGPLAPSGLPQMPDFANHGTVGNLEISGCLFQGGELYYEAGGPQGRSVGVTNSIFERAIVDFVTSHYYGSYTHATEYDPQLAVVNNLLYGGYMKLVPVGANNSWTFTDNIFDRVTFDSYWSTIYNGPVGHNDHNAYIGMSGYHLAPIQNSASDPDLKGLTYQSGSLGRFYLPQDINGPLINKGSRIAGLAGLYHFTTSTANAKEVGSTVDIGPHYVALDGSGNPPDSNSDAVPDFVADANGDGNETGETPWQSQNTSGLAILNPPPGNVSGVVRLRVNPGPYAQSILYLTPVVDNQTSASQLGLPSTSSKSEIEVDTRNFVNGSLTLRVRATIASYNSGRQYSTVDSAPMTITVINPLSFANWSSWAGDDKASFNLNVPTGPDSCGVDVFDSGYPKSDTPVPTTHITGAVSAGAVSCLLTLADVSLLGGQSHPQLFSFATPNQNGTATAPPQAAPITLQDVGFPQVGWWYIAYEDSFTKVYDPSYAYAERPVEDTLQPMSTLTWFTDGALEGWKGVATWHNAPTTFDEPVTGVSGTWPQTWPIRFCNYRLPVNGRTVIDASVIGDWTLFLRRVSDPSYRNLYIGSHMTANYLGILPTEGLWRLIQTPSPHRYHFVFLDGCESGASPALASVFGFDQTEWSTGAPISYYQGLDPASNQIRKRPGGGIVFRTSFTFFIPTPTDLNKAGYIPEEFAQFYINFQANWTASSSTLTRALSDARDTALNSQTLLEVPPWDDNPRCADTIGYLSLRHDEFNSLGTTW